MSYWCFAIINNRLGEIYFDKIGDKIIFLGHCYRSNTDTFTKGEVNAIQQDIPHNQYSYYRSKYTCKNK